MLLRPLRGFGRPGAFGLPRAMHPLVAAVLLGGGGLGEIRQDPQAQPPHGERGESAERLRGEGHPVVRADAPGQAVLGKGASEHRLALTGLRTGQPLTAQQHPAVPIRDGERIAVLTIAELELAFEVRGPNRVGRIHRGLGSPGMSRTAHPARRDHESGAVEMQGEGAARGPGRRRLLLAQHAEQLARSPSGVMMPRLEQGAHQLCGGGTATTAAGATDRPRPAARLPHSASATYSPSCG